MRQHKKLTPKQKEQLAVEIRDWLIDHEMWQDVRIYFNGKCFSTDDGNRHYAYNDRNNLFVLENIDPRDYFEYVSPDDILSMSFEGPLYELLNDGIYTVSIYDDEEFLAIFKKYGCYYELGNSWNLSACYDF